MGGRLALLDFWDLRLPAEACQNKISPGAGGGRQSVFCGLMLPSFFGYEELHTITDDARPSFQMRENYSFGL